MSRIRMGYAISFFTILLLVALTFTSWGGLLLTRIPSRDLALAVIALLGLVAMPVLAHRQALFLLCAALYQLAAGFLFVDFFSRITTFRLMPYRLFGWPPQGWLSSLVLGVATLAVLAVPLAIYSLMFRVFRDKTQRRRLFLPAFGMTIVFAVVGYCPEMNWYRLRHDIQIDPAVISSIADEAYDDNRSRMQNAVSLLAWVNNNIRFEGSNPLLPLPELVSKGKGSCGIQAKVFGALCRVKGYPIRYVQLHSNGYDKWHSVVEIHVNERWVLFDPTHNLVLYNEHGLAASAWDLHNSPDSASSHPVGKDLFENVVIFHDGDYFHVGARNWKWFYF